jgi:hypothetical protein
VRLLCALVLLAGCNDTLRPCATRLTKGPWVERVDDTHATVLWESDANGCVEAAWVPEGGHEATYVAGRATAAPPISGLADAPGFRNEVTLEGLTPSTCYLYRVSAAGTAAVPPQLLDGHFCTTRPPASTVRFLALGDTDPLAGSTVAVLGAVLPGALDFWLHLGDLQDSPSTQPWSAWFGQMAPLLTAGALLPVAGEKDEGYVRLFVPVIAGSMARWYRSTSGGVWFFTLDSESPLGPGDEQTMWLETALTEAAAQPGFRFSVVAIHRPLVTLGDATPLVDARRLLEPLFARTGVKLVLQAHVHGYERFEPPSGITWVTCGGGGAAPGDINANVAVRPDDAALRVAASDRDHACLYTAAPGQLSSTVVDETGAVIDRFEKPVP